MHRVVYSGERPVLTKSIGIFCCNKMAHKCVWIACLFAYLSEKRHVFYLFVIVDLMRLCYVEIDLFCQLA